MSIIYPLDRTFTIGEEVELSNFPIKSFYYHLYKVFRHPGKILKINIINGVSFYQVQWANNTLSEHTPYELTKL